MIYLKYPVKMNLKKYKLLLLFVFIVQISFSQEYFIRTYSIRDGLPTRSINDACQDSKGNMWFATNFGISKYDGFSFTNYENTSGLPDKRYKKIKVDEKGMIWAIPQDITDSIVYFFANQWFKIPPVQNPKVSNKGFINSFDIIYKNDNPVVCIGCFEGFYINENNKWTYFKISENDSDNYINTVIRKQNKFYLATKKGIFIYENGKTDLSLSTLIKPNSDDIISISFENTSSPGNKLWVLSEKWVGYIQDNSFTMVNTKFQLPHPSIYYNAFISADNKGNLFFGNIWAKYYIPESTGIPLPLMVNNGFTSDGATSVFIDREQNVWFTDTRGISKLNNLKLKIFHEKNGMRENEVSAVTEMNDGRIVLGHNKGLSILNPDNSFNKIDFPDSELQNTRVADMMKDRTGNIWFTSVALGLGRLQPNGNINWYKKDKSSNTSAVLQDKAGRIWVIIDGKLFSLQNGHFIQYKHSAQIQATIRKIFRADDGGLFLAGSNGLWYANDMIVKRIPSPSDKKADNVYSYFKDKKGSEFLGTIHGLYIIKNDSIVKFRKNGIEISSPIFFIFQDHSGFYWIGSDNGAYRWDGESKIETYNTFNGLAGWETNRSAGIEDTKGRIWIGTDRGLSCFEPGFDKTIIPTPEIALLYTEDSRGVQHNLTQASKINYVDNTLIFQFRAISFYNENLIEYKYKLEGFDKDWQEVSQPLIGKVKYIGLKPGKYTFCVQARNFSGTWSEITRSAPIIITNPYYFTWWFLLLALILIGAIIYGIVRMNVQRLHNSRLEKEIVERKRIEQALTESRQKFQDLVELLPETIYEADYSGKLIYLNDTGLKLFGYSHEDLKTDSLINQLISPENHDEIRLHMEAVFGLKKSDRAIMTGITKSGLTFPFSIHSVPIVSGNKFIGIRGVIIDLTEQKRFEEQMQRNAEDLQAVINSKDKFFSIIAHDLRSPFTTFLGFTEILDEEIDTLPKEELKSIVTYMRTSAVNLYQLLENLLEWSLLHRDVTRFEPETVQLIPLVNNCINIIADNAKLKEIDLKVEIPDSLNVIADTHMLLTIIRNLLSNAVKFTHTGGSVTISAYATANHFVTLVVKDTGTGIKPDILKNLFIIDANNKTKGTDGELSTGLGLILCKEFVEKNGGKIWVESEEDKGSTFYFTVKNAT